MHGDKSSSNFQVAITENALIQVACFFPLTLYTLQQRKGDSVLLCHVTVLGTICMVVQNAHCRSGGYALTIYLGPSFWRMGGY